MIDALFSEELIEPVIPVGLAGPLATVARSVKTLYPRAPFLRCCEFTLSLSVSRG